MGTNPAYRLSATGYAIRNHDGKPLVLQGVVAELNRLHAALESARAELSGSVGGLTPDPEAVRDIERVHAGSDDDEPERPKPGRKK